MVLGVLQGVGIDSIFHKSNYIPTAYFISPTYTLMGSLNNFRKSFHGQPCVICRSREGTHGEHVKTKKSCGSDEKADHINNVMPICLQHHEQKNRMGINFMAETYPEYKKWLISHGWVFELGKWRNYELEKIIRVNK